MPLEDIVKQITEGDQELHNGILTALSGTEAGKAYATNVAKTYFDENVKLRDKNFYDTIDTQLKEKGIEKPEGMKTSDFILKIASSNKDLADKLAAANSDPDKSNKKMQELIDKHKKEIEEITTNYNKTVGEKDGIIKDLNQKQIVALKSSTIEKALASFTFKKGLGEELIKDVLELKKQKLISNSREEDGKIVWCKEDGTPIKGPNGVTNATLEEVLSSELKSIIETNSPGGNAGKNGDQGSGKFSGKEIIVDMANVSTQEKFLIEFEKVAQAKGLSKSDDNYDDLYFDAVKRYNVAALPEH